MNTYEDGFTFITLTYNHEQYIREHLDSIKGLVQNFGSGRVIDLIIADDCSTDATTERADEWLQKNGSIFRNVKRLYADHNRGTIINIREAIGEADTENFKFFAGDDKYITTQDIFSLVDSIDRNELRVSLVIPFGAYSDDKGFVYAARALVVSIASGRIKQLLKYGCYIQAPGVFYKGELFREPSLWKHLENYKYIEDVPMWDYFINIKKLTVRFEKEPYVQYRLNSGISTQKSHNKHSAFEEDADRIYKALGTKKYKYPKYINIYRYLAKINKLYIYFRRDYINTLIGDDPRLAIYKK